MAVALLLIAGLTGCASASEDEAKPETPTPTPSQSATATSAPPAETPEAPTIKFAAGYPKVVDIASIPDQMRWAFENDGTGKAVAVAEGVWAHLTPGASAEDAVAAKVFDGYCASKEAFEKNALGGESTAGTCW